MRKRGPPPGKLADFFRLKYQPITVYSYEKRLRKKLVESNLPEFEREQEYVIQTKRNWADSKIFGKVVPGNWLEKIGNLLEDPSEWFVPFKAIALEGFLFYCAKSIAEARRAQP